MSAQAAPQLPLGYSVEEANALLPFLSRRTMWRRIEDGSIPSVKLGRRVIIPRQAIEQLLAAADPKRGPVVEVVGRDDLGLPERRLQIAVAYVQAIDGSRAMVGNQWIEITAGLEELRSAWVAYRGDPR